MKKSTTKYELVLCIYPSARGIGYAVFEGSRSLVDWGVKHIRSGRKNARAMQAVRDLATFYHPDRLVIRDYGRSDAKHNVRIKGLLSSIAVFAKEDRMRTVMLGRAEIRACFGKHGAKSKKEIAETVARAFVELEPRLPPVRRIWMSEDARMSMFDAVALGMTYFASKAKADHSV